MNLKHHNILSLLILVSFASLGLGSCAIWNGDSADDVVPTIAFGVRPVYFEGTDAEDIFSTDPREIIDGSGLVLLDDYIFIVDTGEGIHVIDNTDPNNPIPISFIRIIGVTAATANGDRLFANNFGDLVTIDISNILDIEVIDRDIDLFPEIVDYPEGYFGFFECYDPSLGLLLRWEEAQIREPQCSR